MQNLEFWNSGNWIFSYFFDTSFYLWYNSLLPVKYQNKPIKCLEMRTKIKSVQNINKIFLCIFILFETCSFIWGITFHNLKYLDKLIKCIEMRANIKSVWKINEIFICIFTYLNKKLHFFHIPQFWRQKKFLHFQLLNTTLYHFKTWII